MQARALGGKRAARERRGVCEARPSASTVAPRESVYHGVSQRFLLSPCAEQLNMANRTKLRQGASSNTYAHKKAVVVGVPEQSCSGVDFTRPLVLARAWVVGPDAQSPAGELAQRHDDRWPQVATVSMPRGAEACASGREGNEPQAEPTTTMPNCASTHMVGA